MCKTAQGRGVFLKCIAYEGKHKIQDCWQNVVYEVMDQPFEKMHVYNIKLVEEDGKDKVMQ